MDEPQLSGEARRHLDGAFQLFREQTKRWEAEHEAWLRAPMPPYLHSCYRYIEREGVVSGDLVRRCACGSIMGPFGSSEKNKSRRYHRQERVKRGWPKRGRVVHED